MHTTLGAPIPLSVISYLLLSQVGTLKQVKVKVGKNRSQQTKTVDGLPKCCMFY